MKNKKFISLLMLYFFALTLIPAAFVKDKVKAAVKEPVQDILLNYNILDYDIISTAMYGNYAVLQTNDGIYLSKGSPNGEYNNSIGSLEKISNSNNSFHYRFLGVKGDKCYFIYKTIQPDNKEKYALNSVDLKNKKDCETKELNITDDYKFEEICNWNILDNNGNEYFSVKKESATTNNYGLLKFNVFEAQPKIEFIPIKGLKDYLCYFSEDSKGNIFFSDLENYEVGRLNLTTKNTDYFNCDGKNYMGYNVVAAKDGFLYDISHDPSNAHSLRKYSIDEKSKTYKLIKDYNVSSFPYKDDENNIYLITCGSNYFNLSTIENDKIKIFAEVHGMDVGRTFISVLNSKNYVISRDYEDGLAGWREGPFSTYYSVYDKNYTPGTNPGTDPGSNPGTDPGTDPGTNPGSNPGTNPASVPNDGNASAAITKASTGATVVIDCSKNTTAEKNLFTALQGTDKILTLKVGNVEWTFNGKDIKPDLIKDIDLSLKEVSKELTAKEQNKIKAVTGKDLKIASFSFKYDGKLPGKAAVKIFIGKDWAGKNVSICRYYEDKNTYEIVDTCTVDKDGYIILHTDHCSDYFAIENSTIKLPQTGFIFDTNLLILGGIIFMSLGIAFVISTKKKTEH